MVAAGGRLLLGVPPPLPAALLPAERQAQAQRAGRCQGRPRRLAPRGGPRPLALPGGAQRLLQGQLQGRLQGGLRERLQGLGPARLRVWPQGRRHGRWEQQMQPRASPPAWLRRGCRLRCYWCQQAGWEAGWRAGCWGRLPYRLLDAWRCCCRQSRHSQSWQLQAHQRACQHRALGAPPPLGGRRYAGEGPA